MVILDKNGVEITVGARVKRLEEDVSDSGGVITELTELDADYDDELGRAVSSGPYVHVRYDDGESDRYTARWNATGPWDDQREDYTCDDVEIDV